MTCGFVKKNLLDYTEGILENEKRNRVQKHLAECAACRRDADLFLKTLTLSRRISPIPIEKVYWPNFLVGVRNRLGCKFRRQRRFLMRLSWATTIAALTVIGAAWYITSKQGFSPEMITVSIPVTELNAEDIAAFSEELLADPTEDIGSQILAVEGNIDDLLGGYLIEDGLDYLTGDDLIESLSVTDIDDIFDMLIIRKLG